MKKMQTKILERQARDLGSLIRELQDTHSELKVALIQRDYAQSSMYAHDLAGDLDTIKNKYADPLTIAIDREGGRDDEEHDHISENEAREKLQVAAREFGIEVVFSQADNDKDKDKADALNRTECIGHLIGQMNRAAIMGQKKFVIKVSDTSSEENRKTSEETMLTILHNSTSKLLSRVGELDVIWSDPSSPRDDDTGRVLLINTISLACELANSKGFDGRDGRSMRELSNNALQIAESLSTKADDLEAKSRG